MIPMTQEVASEVMMLNRAVFSCATADFGPVDPFYRAHKLQKRMQAETWDELVERARGYLDRVHEEMKERHGATYAITVDDSFGSERSLN